MGKMGAEERCQGCGLVLRPVPNAPSAGRLFASGSCYALNGELAGRTLSLGDPGFVHQYAVDAYTAQHVGPRTKPIGSAFALIGIHLALERGFTGRAVQLAHMELALRKVEWPALETPQERGKVTVADVVAITDGCLAEALRKWMASVWASWVDLHPWVRDRCTGLSTLANAERR